MHILRINIQVDYNQKDLQYYSYKKADTHQRHASGIIINQANPQPVPAQIYR